MIDKSHNFFLVDSDFMRSHFFAQLSRLLLLYYHHIVLIVGIGRIVLMIQLNGELDVGVDVLIDHCGLGILGGFA